MLVNKSSSLKGYCSVNITKRSGKSDLFSISSKAYLHTLIISVDLFEIFFSLLLVLYHIFLPVLML